MASKFLHLTIIVALFASCFAGTVKFPKRDDTVQPIPLPSMEVSAPAPPKPPTDSPLSSRIINGNWAGDGQFKHQISLQRGGGHICGGSFVTDIHVLTAAHCVCDGRTPQNPWEFTVHAGSAHRWEGGHWVSVNSVKVHWGYGDFRDDIALLRLDWAPQDWNIAAIPMIGHEIPDWDTVTISGFGQDEHGGLPTNMKYANMWKIPRQECQNLMGWGYWELLCLGHHSWEGTCFGDSGGPAIHAGYLAGVANFVVNGCAGDYPDAYASVLHHREWVVQNM